MNKTALGLDSYYYISTGDLLQGAKRKAPMNYNILTKEIKDEFVTFVTDIFRRYNGKSLSYVNSYVSSNNNFHIRNGYMEMIAHYNPQATRGQKDYHHTMGFANFTRENISLYSVDYDYQYVIVLKKLRQLFNDMVFEFTGLKPSAPYDFYSTNQYAYSFPKTIKYKLREKLERVFDLSKVPDGQRDLNGYSSFMVTEEMKLQYKFRGRFTSMKLGKGLKKMFKVLNIYHDDEMLKQMVNRLSSSTADYELVVVEGEDISKYYGEGFYDMESDLCGTMGSSCMRHQDYVDDGWFRIYEDNCKMLILRHKTDDLIISRALLWEATNLRTNEPIKMMDRVYSLEKNYNLFFTWAQENGYYRKKYQSYDNCSSFVHPESGDVMDIEASIQMDITAYDNLPYMDTFAWCDGDETRNDEDFGDYMARETGGSYEERERYDEENDNDDIF